MHDKPEATIDLATNEKLLIAHKVLIAYFIETLCHKDRLENGPLLPEEVIRKIYGLGFAMYIDKPFNERRLLPEHIIIYPIKKQSICPHIL